MLLPFFFFFLGTPKIVPGKGAPRLAKRRAFGDLSSIQPIRSRFVFAFIPCTYIVSTPLVRLNHAIYPHVPQQHPRSIEPRQDFSGTNRVSADALFSPSMVSRDLLRGSLRRAPEYDSRNASNNSVARVPRRRQMEARIGRTLETPVKAGLPDSGLRVTLTLDQQQQERLAFVFEQLQVHQQPHLHVYI